MITLEVNGSQYTDWHSGIVLNSLETLSGSFSIKGLNRFGGYTVKSGDECKVYVGDEVVIAGYIDEIIVGLDSSITISGRDKTADFIDCNASSQSVFNNLTGLQIVNLLGSDYNITASGVDTAQIATFILEKDETIAEAIFRIGQTYNIVPTSDEDGNVLFLNGSTFDVTGINFTQGNNINKAIVIASDHKRFSSVSVFGQSYDVIDPSASVSGSAFRTRAHNKLIDGIISIADCTNAATRIRGATNGTAITVILEPVGLLYSKSGNIVNVDSAVLGISDSMLIESTTLSFDGEDAFIEYELVPPEKYGGQSIACSWLK